MTIRRTTRPRAGRFCATMIALGALAATVGITADAGASKGSALVLAKKGVLKLSDFPAGWTASKGLSGSDGSKSSTPDAGQLATCLGTTKAIIEANYTTAYSPTFTSPEIANTSAGETASNQVTVFPSRKIAAKELSLYESAKAPSCLEANGDLQKKALARQLGGTITSLSVTRMTSVSVPGTVGLVSVIKGTVSGSPITITNDMIVGIKGVEGQQVQLVGYNTSVPSSLASSVVAAAMARV